MPKCSTLLIDLDGTLLGGNTPLLHLAFTYHFLNNLKKWDMSRLTSLKVLHELKLKIRDKNHQANGVTNFEKSAQFFSHLSGKSLEDSYAILEETALICFQKSAFTLYPMPEAIEFIAWARPRYNLILATNPLWTPEVVNYRLGIAKITEESFSFITHSKNMSSCKPNPEYYHELIKLKNLNPNECLMIGNSHKKDGPAKDAGVSVEIIRSGKDFRTIRKQLEAQDAKYP